MVNVAAVQPWIYGCTHVYHFLIYIYFLLLKGIYPGWKCATKIDQRFA